MRPPPARLVVTDGDPLILPLLKANVEANAAAAGVPPGEVLELRWRAPSALKASLRGSFDVVLASDALFDTRPPGDVGARSGAPDERTAEHIDHFFGTCAALLAADARAGGQVVLSFEPRDRLGGGLLRECALAAAKTAGLRCTLCVERRLDGKARADWQTDLLVFEPSSIGVERPLQ